MTTPHVAAASAFARSAMQASRGTWMFYEAQRSGKLPLDNRIQWRRDSFMNDRSPSGKCVVGGNFDAGDNVYFGLPFSWTVSTLAYGMAEFPRGHKRSGQLLHAWDNLRWMSDYLLACYISDDEIVVGMGDPDADHAQWQRPEDVSTARVPYVVTRDRPGADVVAGMSAALTSVSYVFTKVDPAYSEMLLAKGRHLYELAVAHPGIYSDSVPTASKFYKSSGFHDELAWAATWLGLRTNNQSYFDVAMDHLTTYTRAGAPWPLPSWDNAYHYTIVILSRKYPQLEADVAAIRDVWIRGTSPIVRTPLGLAWGFQWGSLRHTANAVFFALASVNNLPMDNEIRVATVCWSLSQLEYIMGLTNGTERSFLVGVGKNHPCRPHHRAASCPDAMQPCTWSAFEADACNPHELTGALVGGPGNDDSYRDDRKDFVKNEVALDYNAGFTGLLAGLLEMREIADIACSPEKRL